MDINELWDKYSAMLKSEHAKIRMSECHIGYDYKTDPDYYAADRIRQKRRQKYSSSRPLTIVRDERRVVPPPTNGELQ